MKKNSCVFVLLSILLWLLATATSLGQLLPVPFFVGAWGIVLMVYLVFPLMDELKGE